MTGSYMANVASNTIADAAQVTTALTTGIESLAQGLNASDKEARQRGVEDGTSSYIHPFVPSRDDLLALLGPAILLELVDWKARIDRRRGQHEHQARAKEGRHYIALPAVHEQAV
ncbi:hypothetical protein LTR17_014268 [Elasticomyces elasticus]|nr:hypothetical protein LTR17_014268 [Elasticomyces elasticus]